MSPLEVFIIAMGGIMAALALRDWFRGEPALRAFGTVLIGTGFAINVVAENATRAVQVLALLVVIAGFVLVEVHVQKSRTPPE